MARRKKSGHANSERWLVSYADFVTLLFAFFVVLFASTQSDHVRAKQISQAVDKALQGGSFKQPQKGASENAAAKHPDKAQEEVHPQSDLLNAVKKLQNTLSNEVAQGQVRVHLEPRGAVISLNAQSVFPSGGDTIDNSVYPLLAKVSATLNQLENPLRLEGHTDSMPISNQRFHSNWELSAARSIAMLRILNERYGVNRNRMAIVGYADTSAVGDNETEEGRIKNRRVDLVILSDFGRNLEPRAIESGERRSDVSAAAPSAP